MIFQVNRDPDTLFSPEVKDICGFYRNISSQLPSRSFFSTFNNFVGGSSQIHGEKTQDYREDGDKDGSHRNHFFMVVMNEISSRAKTNFENSVRRGTVVLVGLGCFATFNCIYLWLITRGKPDDENAPENNDKANNENKKMPSSPPP